MDSNELALQRCENFSHAVRMDKAPKRVPHISSYMTWKIIDEGYKFSEALNNWDLMEEIVMNWQKRYNFDLLREWGSRNPIPVLKDFAKTRYVIDDEQSFISADDYTMMEADEYDELINNTRQFTYEKLFNRRYTELKDISYENVKKTILAYKEFIEWNGKMVKRLHDETGVPYFSQTGMSPSAFDMLMTRYRGIKQVSIDLRRQPDKIQEYCDKINNEVLFPQIEALKKGEKGSAPGFAFDMQSGGLGHTILSRPQWERYYMPGLKAIFNYLEEMDKTSYWFWQGSMDIFHDYFQDVEKGHICMHVEQGDIFAIRKKLPNISLAGGMPMTMLYHSTPEECVDMAKRLVDEIGSNGGFILSQDKMGSYPKDTKRENLLAVCEFIQNYGE